MHTLQIYLLGNFQLLYANEVLTSVNTPRLQTLLVYLLLHRQAPQSRQHLAFQLWPDSAESQARTNLRKLFFQLQHALPDAKHFLYADTKSIGWNPKAAFTLDVAQLQQQLAHLQQEPLDTEALRQVVALYQGELLPSCYEDWIAPLRQQLHQAVMIALERLITLLENQRAYTAGIDYARRLLTFDPLEEKSYQRLMRLHALEGDYSGALRVYQDCVTMLQNELDVEPAAETQELYERLRRRDPTLVPPPQVERLPLVGRQQEWQLLQQTWRQTLQGQTHLVCLWGEAGIGKTRLAEELLDWASHQGVLTAHTRSYQAHGALAYAPITGLLRNHTLAVRLRRLSETWLTQIARLLPELLEERPGIPKPQPMTEGWQSQHFWEALAHAVLIDEQPLLLVFDDLHWCDQETLAWLHYLLRFAPQARLLIVGTSRIEEVADTHALTQLCQSLRRAALITELELPPLNATEVITLADTLTDQVLTPAQVQQLYADTEGNPLFVVETIRVGPIKAQASPGQATRQQGTGQQTKNLNPATKVNLPPKVYAVLHARLTQLSPQAQKIASLAAVIGRSFSFAVLAAAAHMDEDTLIDSLDELGERRILREQATDGYDFSHDRIREVAYIELSRARRHQLHRHVAEALETVYAKTLDERSGILAEQWEQAGNRDKAVTYLQRAGERAATHYLHTEATRHIGRALELTPPEHYAKICQLLLTREQSYWIQGDQAVREQDLALLQEILLGWNDDPQQALVLRAEVAFRMSRYERELSHIERSIAYARQAVELAQQGNAAQQETNGLLELGQLLWIKANFIEARMTCTRALQRAEAANLPSRLAESLEKLAQIDMYTGGSAASIMQYLERALVNYEKDGNLIGKCNIFNKLGYLPVAQGVGDYSQARLHYEQGLALSRKIGDRANEIGLLRNLGVLFVCEGNYGQAEQCLNAAHQFYLQQGSDDWAAILLNYLGFAYFNKGQLAQAKTAQEAALHELSQRQLHNQWVVKALTSLGWIHLILGDLKPALAYTHQASQASLAINELRQAAYAFTCMGHVLTELQRYTEAIAAFQQAVTFHQQMQQDNRRMEPLAGLAQVALLQGDMPQAQRLGEEILTHLQTHTLDRTEETLRVYLTCYRILDAQNGSRAQDLLCAAYDQLQKRAATIEDLEAQRLFWEAIPDHQWVRRMIGRATIVSA